MQATKIIQTTFIIVAFFGIMINILTLFPGHNWGDDFAQYIIHAQNIVKGEPYTANYSLHPQGIVYPPGYPLLLAAYFQVFEFDWFLLKLINLICWYGSLGMILFLFRKRISPLLLYLFLTLIAASSLFFEFKQNLLSDLPFLFFNTLLIVVLQSCFKRLTLFKSILLIALSIFVVMLRSMGVVTILAAMVFAIWIKRDWKIVGILITGFVSYLMIQALTFGFFPGQLAQVKNHPMEFLNSIKLFNALPAQSLVNIFIPIYQTRTGFTIGSSVYPILNWIHIPLLLVFLGFFLWRFIRRESELEEVVFTGLYLLLVFWSGFRDSPNGFTRFLYPLFFLMPLIIQLYVSNPLQRVMKQKLRPFLLESLLLSLCLLFNIYSLTINYQFNDDVFYRTENKELFTWMQENIAEEEGYLFNYFRAAALETGRLGVYHQVLQSEDIISFGQVVGLLNMFPKVEYLILVKGVHDFWIEKLARIPAYFNPIWDNEGYFIFDVDRSKLATIDGQTFETIMLQLDPHLLNRLAAPNPQ